MKVVGRIVGAVAVTALLAGSALAQKGPARYGETDKDKTPTEKAAEKDAERAYQRSLGNIPEQKNVDPWGIARGDGVSRHAVRVVDHRHGHAGNDALRVFDDAAQAAL